MPGYKCPTCGDGTMEPLVIKNYPARLSGVEFVVPEAHFKKCTKCPERTVNAREIKRWRQILQGMKK